MKKRSVWLASGIVSAFVLLSSSSGVLGAVSGSKHDFTATTWAEGQICLPCHTPHHGELGMDAPLWNHENTTATYSLYSSATLDVTVGQPGPISKACLSCHDGTIALDSFGHNKGAGTEFISGDANLGTDLSDDHPIGFAWTEYHATLGGAPCVTCHPGTPGLDAPVIEMFGGQMECATCHDVHNSKNFPSMTVMSMVGSEMCQTCHFK